MLYHSSGCAVRLQEVGLHGNPDPRTIVSVSSSEDKTDKIYDAPIESRRLLANDILQL